MKYKSHDFTTLLAKTEVTLEGKERRVSPHPIPLGPEDFFFFPPQDSLSSMAACWVSQRPKSKF